MHPRDSTKTDKKIVITGGAGYIGWHLSKSLLDKGWEVTVFDDLLFGDNVVRHLKGTKNFTFIKGNILNIDNLIKTFKDAYAVIHLAAVVGDPACSKNPDFTKMVNIESTKTIIDIANHYSITRFLFASSCSVYGVSQSDIFLNEGSYMNPVSLYAETRIISEEIILSNCVTPVPTILRLATAYGYSKRMRFDLAVNLMTIRGLAEGRVKVFGGRQYRPFVHCEDIARAFAFALEAPESKVKREVFNVGSNEQNYRLEELGAVIGETLHVPVNVLPELEDERSYRADFSKIRWLLGFDAQRQIRESVLEIKEHFERGDFGDWKDNRYYNVRYDYML